MGNSSKSGRVVVEAGDCFEIAQHIARTDVEGYTVVLDSKKGVYFGLNRIASDVLEMLAAGQSVGAVNEELAKRYKCDPVIVEHDLFKYVAELFGRGIVEPV